MMVSDRQNHKTEEKIRTFADLQVGWHYGNGIRPSDKAIEKALILNTEAIKSGFEQTNAFPGIDGEIRVTAYHQSIYVEMTIEIDDSVTYIYEFDDNERENVVLTFDQVKAKLRNFRGHLWGSYVLSTLTTMTTSRADFKVSLSETPVTGVVSPSSITSAFYEQAQVSATILEDSIELSPEAPQFSGKYRSKFFLRPVA
jgi:hypothetical protein